MLRNTIESTDIQINELKNVKKRQFYPKSNKFINK